MRDSLSTMRVIVTAPIFHVNIEESLAVATRLEFVSSRMRPVPASAHALEKVPLGAAVQ
jgi:hypothetical protein